MDKHMKKSLFGGYQKAAVQAAIGSLEQQLEENRVLNSRLQKENADSRENSEKLENTCRSLKNEIAAKSNEIRRLSSQLEDFKQRYEHSVSVQKEYERYLQTVGQIYMVACDSAGNIVNQADTSARQLISSLSDSTEKARAHMETAASAAMEAREKLTDTLPALIKTINGTFRQIDDFLDMANRVPESYSDVLNWQKSTLNRMEREIEDYKRASQTVAPMVEQPGSVSRFEKIDTPVSADTDFSAQKSFLFDENSTISANKRPDLILLKDKTPCPSQPLPDEPAAVELKHAVNYSEDPVYPDAEIEPTPKTESIKPHLSLLEQEKMRRRQQQSAEDGIASEDERPESSFRSSFESSQDPQCEPESSAVEPDQYKEPAASGPQPNMSNSSKHRPNVKELLNKYSQIKN